MSNLERTPTSTGNRVKATWSFWVKRNALSPSSSRYLFYAASGSGADAVRYNDDDGGDSLRALFWDGTANNGFINFDKLRDTSSWQHILIVYDSTLNTKDNFSNNDQTLERIKIFVNGRRMIETGGNSAQNIGIGTNQLLTKWGNAGIVNALFATDTGSNGALITTFDAYFVDGQALTPDVFGFYKDGNGHISLGSSLATDFKPGQWVPKTPRVIKAQIERNGGFGVNGYYLPMNDSSNFGADFHTTPNSIIKLQEDLPQPKVSIASTAQAGLAYTDVLRADPYAANLVLAVPGVTGGIGTDGTSSGINTGFGDYSALIKGSGSPKIMKLSSSLSIGATAAYYGSAMLFNGSDTQLTTSTDLTDFAFGTGDFTLECWYSGVPEQRPLFELRGAAAGTGNLFVGANGEIFLGGSQQITPATGITTGQFTHIAVERNGSLLTRYINGVATGIKTNFTANVVPPNTEARFGMDQSQTSFYNGYIQDLRVYKGVAKYKDGFDVPKPFTPVGIATWRVVPDTTANNFANALPVASDATFSDGNLTTLATASGHESWSSIGIPTTGRWYAEARMAQRSGFNHVGVQPIIQGFVQKDENRVLARDDGNVYGDSSEGLIGTISAFNTVGDILGVAVNSGIASVTFYVNGTEQNTFRILNFDGVNGTGINTFADYHFNFLGNNGDGINWNFGQNPTFGGNVSAAATQRNADSNGKGEFRYAPPTDFLALCTDNLPTPIIEDPGKYFKTVLYTGSGADSQSVVGVGFTPDLVWLKRRHDSGSGHIWTDSVRGPGFSYFSNNTASEDALSASGYLSSFDSDGFSLKNGTSNGTRVKNDGDHYVAWCWQAGAGTTSANTSGTINSTVSVSPKAGFSIVSYQGDGSDANRTVGHGLNKTPSFIILKPREASRNWLIWHKSIGDDQALLFDNGTPAGSRFGPSAPTSDVFGVFGGQGNRGTTNFIAYCWSEVPGFSKFGSYIGNGSADGTFVSCGFKPAWVLVKRISASDGWLIMDSSRSPTNPVTNTFAASTSNRENADTGGIPTDFVANGFVCKGSGGDFNGNNEIYIFAAFAESPFKYSNSK